MNDSKVEAAAERGANKMLLIMFDDTHASKLKHPIKLYEGTSCCKLIDHLRKTYRKSHQLNVSDLMTEMKDCFGTNEGFSKCLEKMKEAQKTASTIDPNLINDAALLRMGIEAMRDCRLFEKAFDEWEDKATVDQSWPEF